MGMQNEVYTDYAETKKMQSRNVNPTLWYALFLVVYKLFSDVVYGG